MMLCRAITKFPLYKEFPFSVPKIFLFYWTVPKTNLFYRTMTRAVPAELRHLFSFPEQCSFYEQEH